MPVFYLETADQMSLLVTLCFSFFIFLTSLWFKKSDVFSRLFGLSFFTPFILSMASFISHKNYESDLLSLLAELFVLLLIFLLIVIKPSSSHYRFIAAILLLLPFAVWLAVNNLSFLLVNLQEPSIWILSYLIIAIADMFLLKKEHNTRGILFWPPLPLAVLPVIHLLVPGDLSGYLSFVFKLVTYLIILDYFYKVYYGVLSTTVSEAQEKINMVNHSLNLEVKKRVFEIEQVNRNLVNKSKTDALTNAFNKSAILAEIDNMVSAKGTNEFSIIMFDVDEFKKINDTLGHVEGDKCLKKLSIIARNNIRDIDTLGRYGGDEFVIVLPGTGLNHALQIAERFRKRVDSSESPHFTISIGIASYPNDGKTTRELIKAADDGLYFSKSKGRNAVSYKKNY